MVEVTAAPPPQPEPPLSQCFDRCLDTLPADGRRLILQYYTHAPRGQIAARAAMARDLTLSPNALRSRAQRLRDRLERCVGECLERSGITDSRSHGVTDARHAITEPRKGRPPASADEVAT